MPKKINQKVTKERDEDRDREMGTDGERCRRNKK